MISCDGEPLAGLKLASLKWRWLERYKWPKSGLPAAESIPTKWYCHQEGQPREPRNFFLPALNVREIVITIADARWIFLADITLDGRTHRYVFARGTVTAVMDRDEILEPFVRLFTGTVGRDFNLMDDNPRNIELI
ncbi:hypothetical protein TNCV_963811 [Trichonephila clavipes]|nr:hypothetical protein TNCV_963811 [Trichonephila clavipes]